MKLGFYKELARRGYTDTPTFSVDTVQGFTQVLNNTLYIVFRGTDSKQDWINNFMFSKEIVPYDGVNPKIKVHSGWLNQYKQNGVRDYIQKIVNDFVGKVVVVGHSYGAALAIICSLDLEYNFPTKPVFCVAFSAPRVGNRAFVNSFKKRMGNNYIIPYIGNDIVHHAPPIIFNFRHPKTKIFGKRNFFKFLINTFQITKLWITKMKIDNIEDLDLFGDHDIWRDGKGPSGKTFPDVNVMDDNFEISF